MPHAEPGRARCPRSTTAISVKQPYFIHPADGDILCLAGLYELWPDPDKAENDPDRAYALRIA